MDVATTRAAQAGDSPPAQPQPFRRSPRQASAGLSVSAQTAWNQRQSRQPVPAPSLAEGRSPAESRPPAIPSAKYRHGSLRAPCARHFISTPDHHIRNHPVQAHHRQNRRQRSKETRERRHQPFTKQPFANLRLERAEVQHDRRIHVIRCALDGRNERNQGLIRTDHQRRIFFRPNQ